MSHCKHEDGCGSTYNSAFIILILFILLAIILGGIIF